jgi:predicted transcriptional regulator
MKFEDYIQKHRNELDYRKADKDRIWQGIQAATHQRKTKRVRFYQWSAAAVIILLISGMFLRQEFVLQRQIENLSQINNSLAQKEQAYQVQINQKWQQFQSIQSSTSPIEGMLIDELKELDTLYQEGLKDIQKDKNNERAIMILLETYEKRLRIIEKLIYERHKQIKYEERNPKTQL